MLEQDRKLGRIVKVPVKKRFTSIVDLPPLPGSRTTLCAVDGIGLFVHHTSPECPSDDEIRRHLIGVERIYLLVEADSIAEAILKFPDQYPAAMVGERAMALKIEPSETYPFEIYPPCPLMHLTRLGYIVCGKPEPDGMNGEYGGCIIDGFDPPENCPIEKYFEEEGKPHHSI